MLDRLEGQPQQRHAFDYLIVAAPAEAEKLRDRLCEDGGAARCWTSAGGINPASLGALMLDGDHCGGVTEAMALAMRIMADGPRLPVVILLRGLSEQIFPSNPRVDPVLLRKPLSRLTLRVARDYLLATSGPVGADHSKSNGAPPFPVRPV